MFKRLKLLPVIAVAWMPLPLAGMTLDLNLSDEAAEFRYAAGTGVPNMETEVSWLHEQNNGDILGVGVYAKDDALPGSQVLEIAVGGRLFAMETTENGPDGSGLAVGGRFRYTIPSMDRLGISGELYIAPSVVSGGDLDGFRQWAVRGEYQILRQANVYLGYRRVEPDFGGGSVDFESGLHAGLRLNF